MYTLYYYPNNASLAPHFLLHHMNLEYKLLFVDKKANFQKSAEYLKLNPAGVIPTLIENGQPITESPAICIHLCESYPEYGLIPSLGDSLRPLFFQWMAYLNNTLQADLMFSNYAHTHTNDEDTIPNIVAAQSDCIADALAIIDAQLEGKQYLLGDKLTACDYFLFMLAGWSFHGKTSPLAFKSLAAYLKRMCNNATIKAVCETEDIDLTSFESYQA